MPDSIAPTNPDEFDAFLESIYEDYTDNDIERIKEEFVELLMGIARKTLNTEKVPRDCFTLILDLRTILSEIIGNGLRHGKNPTCKFRVNSRIIVAKVINVRCEEENGVFVNCGRGMTCIKELIMEHSDIRINHSHTENATVYKAFLHINLEDFTNHIKQHCTPKA